MSVGRWMVKEDVVHIYTGMLLSHKKWNIVSCSNTDGSRDYHSKWYKLIERQTPYTIIYVWNLKYDTSEPVTLLSYVWLFAIPWTTAYQAPPSLEFSRQEYWSGLPFSSPGDLPNPGIEPRSPALQADTLPSELPGKPPKYNTNEPIYETETESQT